MKSSVLCVGILSPGDMGHGIARVLVNNKVEVITCLAGRSQRTSKLAEAAGMRVVESDVELVQQADVVLSIVVPSCAEQIVDRIIAACRKGDAAPLFADLNAIAPETVKQFSAKMQGNGLHLVDGGILGGPPNKDGSQPPRIYVSGARATELLELTKHGLDVRVLGGEVGQASGFKMAYAAVNKGLVAIGTQAFIAAKEIGLGEEFAKEMSETQPELYAKLVKGIPSMCPKAYRWVGEMEEIAKTYISVGMTGNMYKGAAEMFQLITDSPLGKEIVEERKLGTTVNNVVETVVQYKNHQQ